MAATPLVRPIREDDYAAWAPLWAGYNTFYGRDGPTALAPETTAATWKRFFDANEPVHALVAELDGQVVGLVHYLFHRSTNRIEPVCYLQDLFTKESVRGRGVARTLIEAVYVKAREHGAKRVYWHTQDTNTTARALYDKVAKHAGFIVYAHEGSP
jgi:GNAT superfamily N-acetyltransferase